MKSTTAKIKFGALLVAAFTTLTAARASEFQTKIVGAAQQEGKVNVYSVMPAPQNEVLTKAFKAKYPAISLNLIRGAGELPARIQAEMNSGVDGADVIIYSDPSFLSRISDNLLPIAGPSVDGWNAANWQDAAKQRIPIITTFPVYMLLWNTNIFPNGFKTWEDLLDPSVKGKLGLKNDFTTSMAATIDFQERAHGTDYLRKLGQQSPKYYASAIPMNQAVASGELGVTNLATPAGAKALVDLGAPVKYSYPEPTLSSPIAAGALSKSKRPNAALVFVDFMMSAQGQEAINGNGFGSGGRPNIPGALDLSKSEVYDSTKYTPELMAQIRARFDSYFGKK
jgi:iron(III) transport system substrate-binding protein